MAHHLYHTRGFIAGGLPTGEASRLIFCFTDLLGFIPARAQGVRQEPSKLRHHLSPYGRGAYTLVRGREVWRLIGAETEAPVETLAQPPRLIFHRLLNLVIRFAPREEAIPALFSLLDQFWRTFSVDSHRETDYDAGDWYRCELYVVARLLATLGYVPLSSPIADVSFTWSKSKSKIIGQVESTLLRSVNDALTHSHL